MNTKATNLMLSIRKMSSQDYLFRIYQKALQLFKKDGEDRFKVVFARHSDIEQYLKAKGVLQS